MAFNFGQQPDQTRGLLLGALAASTVGVALYGAQRLLRGGPEPVQRTGRGSSRIPHATRALSKTPEDWSTNDVTQWLHSVEAGQQVIEAFQEHDVNGATLPLLQDAHLADMGISKIGQRIKVLRSIRSLFQLPTNSLPPTPAATTPSVSAARQRHADPAATVPAARSFPAAEELTAAAADDGDELVVDSSGSNPYSPYSSPLTPAVVPRTGTGSGSEVNSVAGKLSHWVDRLNGPDFANAEPAARIEMLSSAEAEIAPIVRVLDGIDVVKTPQAKDLKEAAHSLFAMVTRAKGLMEKQKQQPTVAQATEAGALQAVVKVAELLEQFQKVLAAPEILSLPAEQRIQVVGGIGKQLEQIQAGVVPALPEPHRAAVAKSTEALLRMAVKLSAPVLEGQEDGTAAETTAQQASAGTNEEPASLNFLVQRLRQVFEQVKSSSFQEERDPAVRRDMLANAAREVHQLSMEGERLPEKERVVVRQVSQNIVGVLNMLAKQLAEAGGSGDNRGAQASEEGEEQEPDMEVAQLISKQLIAMLNVLKSDAFEQASPAQRAEVAAKMKVDLEKISRLTTQQPQQVQEMLLPTQDKLGEFLHAVLAMHEQQQQQKQSPSKAQPKAPTATTPRQAAERSAARPSASASTAPTGHELSQKLLTVLQMVQSDEFESLTPGQRRITAAKFKKEVQTIMEQLDAQPEQVRNLLTPTAVKVDRFLDVFLGEGDGAPAPPSRPSKQNSTQKSPSGKKRDGVIGQLQRMVDVLQSSGFQRLPAVDKLDEIVRCQERLGLIAQGIAKLPTAEQEEAMGAAQQVNQLLKELSDPILASVEEGAQPAENDDEQGEEATRTAQEKSGSDGKNERAMLVVQQAQELFASINADEFLDASPEERSLLSRNLRQRLNVLQRETRTLEPEHQQNILPLLSSLTSVLEKLDSVSSVADEATAAQAANDEEGKDVDDEERNDVFQAAANATTAMQAGRLKVNSVVDLERLSQLMDRLDQCGIRSEEEIRIRENFQLAVEKAMQQLSENLSGDQDPDMETRGQSMDEDAETQNPLERTLLAVIEAVENATSEAELRPVLSVLTDILQKGEWQKNRKHEDLLQRAAGLVKQKREAFASAAVHSSTTESPTAGLKRELLLLKRAITSATRAELPAFMDRLTRLTAQSSNWKEDAACVAVVNDCLKAIQEASKRLTESRVVEVDDDDEEEEDEEEEEDDADGPGMTDPRHTGETQLSRLLDESTARLSADANPDQFFPLARSVLQKQANLSDAEKRSFVRFDAALRHRMARGDAATEVASPVTPAGQKRTPPNSPADLASPLTPAGQKRTPPNTPATMPVDEAGPRGSAARQEAGDEEEEDDVPGLDRNDDDDDEAEAGNDDEKQYLAMLSQLRSKVSESDISSLEQLVPYVAVVKQIREAATELPRVMAAAGDLEEVIRQRVASIRQRAQQESSTATASNRVQNLQRLVDILGSPQFKQLQPEIRGTTLRKAITVLDSLTPQEQMEHKALVEVLLEAVDRATSGVEDANEEANAKETAPMSDMEVVPRILERLQMPDFMQQCSVFEVGAIGRTLSRLDDSSITQAQPDFAGMIHTLTNLFAERVQQYEGEPKRSEAVACPLQLTGLTSEADGGDAVVRYTLYSPEEEEEFTPDPTIIKRFQRAPGGDAPFLTEKAVETWKSGEEGSTARSVAMLFCFAEHPLHAESKNDTAQSELTDLADVLETMHGFDVWRCHGTPTSDSFANAFAKLKRAEAKDNFVVERLLIYVMNPALKTELPAPPPQHAVLFENGSALKYTTLLEMAAEATSRQTLLVHDFGSGLEVAGRAHCDKEGNVGSALVGASVTEAGYLVANSSRCWLYDGLVTPIIIEAISQGARTLSGEDLVNSFVRTLIAKDGGDGPYLRAESPATGFAFFAPGLAKD